MLLFVILIIVSILTMLSCCLTFNKSYHDKWYYMPFGLFVALMCNLLWYGSAKYLHDEKKVYIFSLYWDFVVCSIYLFFPLIIINTKLDKWCYIGIFLMFLGMLIIKIKS
jgi:hypothetical protein